jgi:porphobilinogen deaminase
MHEQKLDGIVLAAAGLKRIGRESEITQYFSVEEMIPAPAQGVLALELRADDEELLKMVNAMSDERTDREVRAERIFLKKIGGDCHLPIGACAATAEDGSLTLRALFGSEDGSWLKTVTLCGNDPDALGEEAAQKLLEEG